VNDVITSHALPPITMKGISREVIPYSVDSMIDTSADKGGVVIERMPGLDFYLDPSIVKSADAERIRSVLLGALSALDKRQANPAV
jgi:adenylate cyclase